MREMPGQDGQAGLDRRRFKTLGGGVLGAMFGTLPAVLAKNGGRPKPITDNGSQLRRKGLQAASMTDPVGIDVTFPPNTAATIELPLGPVGGAGARVSASSCAALAGNDGTTATWNVGPGHWYFRAVTGS
jgi:hypothetical protein